MRCDFALHTMDWNSVAPLIREFRFSARTAGMFRADEPIADNEDALSHHALALMNGKVIGAARITRQGEVGRVLVLPHECQAKIEAALLEALETRARTLAPCG